jgi:hypothetical protein
MKALLTLAALAWWGSLSVAAGTDEPVRVNDLGGNVQARLVGAKRSAGRGAWLIAKFETLDKERREIEIVFPAHSFTTHEATLKAIILSCSDWGDAPDHSKWGRVRGEVIFSVPPKGAHFSGGGGTGAKTLDHCYLVSLKVEASK